MEMAAPSLIPEWQEVTVTMAVVVVLTVLPTTRGRFLSFLLFLVTAPFTILTVTLEFWRTSVRALATGGRRPIPGEGPPNFPLTRRLVRPLHAFLILGGLLCIALGLNRGWHASGLATQPDPRRAMLEAEIPVLTAAFGDARERLAELDQEWITAESRRNEAYRKGFTDAIVELEAENARLQQGLLQNAQTADVVTEFLASSAAGISTADIVATLEGYLRSLRLTREQRIGVTRYFMNRMSLEELATAAQGAPPPLTRSEGQPGYDSLSRLASDLPAALERGGRGLTAPERVRTIEAAAVLEAAGQTLLLFCGFTLGMGYLIELFGLILSAPAGIGAAKATPSAARREHRELLFVE